MQIEISEKMAGIKPSVIREMFKYAGRPDVISLAAGSPSPEALPLDFIKRTTARILEEEPNTALMYSLSEGYPRLREALKAYLKDSKNIVKENDELFITSGAQQVMDITAKALCNKGDTVICENPSFIGSLNTFRSYNVNLVGVDVEKDGISAEKLEAALKANPNTKIIYLIPNFQNPTGITMSAEKRKKVYSLAVKYGVFILEDNPYGDLRFEGEDIPTIKSMDTEGIVIYAGTFSKILSPGMRVGYMVFTKELAGALSVAKQCTDVHTNILAQMICCEFVKSGEIDRHIAGIKDIYKSKCTLMLNEMAKKFPADIEYTKPSGGLFIWIKLRAGTDASQFAEKLVLEKKVCAVTGAAFNVDGSPYSEALRVNFSTPSDEDIVKAIDIIGSALSITA